MKERSLAYKIHTHANKEKQKEKKNKEKKKTKNWNKSSGTSFVMGSVRKVQELFRQNQTYLSRHESLGNNSAIERERDNNMTKISYNEKTNTNKPKLSFDLIENLNQGTKKNNEGGGGAYPRTCLPPS